jgi:hypothetical protein
MVLLADMREIPFGRPRLRWENKFKWNMKKWDVGHGLE